MPHTPATLFAKLDDLGLAYTNHHHKPVFTVEEAKTVDADIEGCHVKNLFLRDKKKTKLWLVTTLHDTRVDLKALRHSLGASGNLSFCNADVLMEHLGVTPGSVTPLAVINDTQKAVTAVLDARIMAVDIVNPHPLINDQTTSLSPADLVRFMEAVHTAPTLLEIPQTS